MTQEQQLAKTQQDLQNALLLHATAHLQWNEAYDGSVRPAILNQVLTEQLNKLNGKLVVDGLDLKIVHKDLPNTGLISEQGKPLDFAGVLDSTLQVLSSKGVVSGHGKQIPLANTGTDYRGQPDYGYKNPFLETAKKIIEQERKG